MKPVLCIFLIVNISPATNPLAFTTDIVCCVAEWNPPGFSDEPVSTVEFATYNWPPTAFTDSFSNTAVDNVPRILAFSTSKNPPLAAVNLNPLPATSLAKPADSIVPSLRIIISPPVKASAPKFQPPTVPDSAFKTPALVTLNGASLKVESPSCIPVPGTKPIKSESVPPLSFVASTLNPPILPPVNNTCDPVMSPFCFTLKLVVFINLYLSSSTPPTNGLPLMKILVLLKELSSVLKPPIKPADAVIVPTNSAPLAIKIPSLSTMKFGPILM